MCHLINRMPMEILHSRKELYRWSVFLSCFDLYAQSFAFHKVPMTGFEKIDQSWALQVPRPKWFNHGSWKFQDPWSDFWKWTDHGSWKLQDPWPDFWKWTDHGSWKLQDPWPDFWKWTDHGSWNRHFFLGLGPGTYLYFQVRLFPTNAWHSKWDMKTFP